MTLHEALCIENAKTSWNTTHPLFAWVAWASRGCQDPHGSEFYGVEAVKRAVLAAEATPADVVAEAMRTLVPGLCDLELERAKFAEAAEKTVADARRLRELGVL